MLHPDFQRDRLVAVKTEDDIANKLKRMYGARLLEVSRNNEYDLKMVIQGKVVTIEIKEDFTCEKTGNVGLEYSCREKPSGISVSKADYYIYKLHTRRGIVYVMHKTAILKAMIEEKKYFTTVNGGDKGSNSLNYLFKYNEFIKTGQILPLDK